jgi:hypothetical protein
MHCRLRRCDFIGSCWNSGLPRNFLERKQQSLVCALDSNICKSRDSPIFQILHFLDNFGGRFPDVLMNRWYNAEFMKL